MRLEEPVIILSVTIHSDHKNKHSLNVAVVLGLCREGGKNKGTGLFIWIKISVFMSEK